MEQQGCDFRNVWDMVPFHHLYSQERRPSTPKRSVLKLFPLLEQPRSSGEPDAVEICGTPSRVVQLVAAFFSLAFCFLSYSHSPRPSSSF
jgi:hypothetical protein